MRAALAIAAALLAATAEARVIDYAAQTAEVFAADAAELKINPVSPTPARGRHDLVLDAAATLDHETLALGMYCSGYKVENLVSAMLRVAAAEFDRDGVLSAAAAGAPRLTVKVATARSYRRCVEAKEANVRCITRVMLAGEAESPGPDGAPHRFPIAADVERDSSVGGFCGSLARGIAVVTREAGRQLIAEALAKAAPPAASQPSTN